MRKYAFHFFSGIFILSVGIYTYFSTPQIPKVYVPLLNTHASFDGTVAADPDLRETKIRVTVRVLYQGMSTKIIAVVPRYTKVSYGEQVTISGKLYPPEPFATDGGRTFRYDQFLAKDGVFALMPIATLRVTGPPRGLVDTLLAFLYALKARFARSLARALPEPQVSLAVGILVGGKQGLGPSLLAAFGVAGMLQLVVLSGYNVMVVAEAILWTTRRLPRVIGFIIADVAIVLFVIMAGANSSAVRAGIMATIALLGRAFYRKYDVLRALVCSLCVMLVFNPLLLLYDPGLQLSFLATVGLILGATPIATRILWIKSAFLQEAISTTLAAQIAVLPVLLYQSGNLSLVALPANVLAMPLVPLAMGTSAAAAVVGFVAPTFAPYAGLPAYVLLTLIVKIAQVSARLPFAQIVLPAFPAWWLLPAYGALAVLLVLLTKPPPQEIASQRPPS